MIKILFFDIDGTLLELGKKEMHQELIIALNEVKKKGIKINVIKLRNGIFEGNTKNVLLFFCRKFEFFC